ncbi:MAG: STAS domain-containing protein [Actinomycetota bacterium]
MEEFQLASRQAGDWTVIDIWGEVDVNTAPRLKEAIVATVARDKTMVALNLAGVGFLDSTGLAVLVGGAKRARQANGDLALISPNEQILRVLSITNLIKVLPVYASVEALAGIKDDGLTKVGT